MLNLMFIHLVGLMTPGPDFFYVVRMAAANTKRNIICGIIGITLGVTFWAFSAMLGLAVLINAFPIIHSIIMLLGGGYLAYLGVLMLKIHTNASFDSPSDDMLNHNTTIKKEILKGLFINLSNAKAILYFASVMSLILGNLTETWQILTALFIIVVETFLYFYVVSILFSRPAAKKFYSKYSRYIDNGAGIIFLAFGLFLVYGGMTQFHIGG